MIHHITVNDRPLCAVGDFAIFTLWNPPGEKAESITCSHATKEKAELAAWRLRLLNPDRHPNSINVAEGSCPESERIYDAMEEQFPHAWVRRFP